MTTPSLVNTFVNFSPDFFDRYESDFSLSENSFDIEHHTSFPQFFIDYVNPNPQNQQNPQSEDESKSYLQNVSTTTDRKELASIDMKFIEFLFAFGLSYTQNGYFDPSTQLRPHQQIIEEDLLLILPKTDSSSQNSWNFIDHFDDIAELLQNSLKPVIFAFVVNGQVHIKTVGSENLQKSSVVLIYSKHLARFLNYNSFFYHSRNTIRQNSVVIQPYPKVPAGCSLNIFQMYEYTLKGDHWVTRPEPRFFEPIISFFRDRKMITNFNNRSDYLSVDFAKLFQNNNENSFVFVGLIGHSKDIFERMGIVYFINNHSDDKNPDVKPFVEVRNPGIYLNYSRSEGKTHYFYVFLYIPHPGAMTKAFCSPSTQAYQDATFDAINRMRNFCSIVVNLQRSDLGANTKWKLLSKADISNPGKSLPYSSYLSIVGHDFEQIPLMHGSESTLNVVEVLDVPQSANQSGTVFEFDSLVHLIQWIEFKSKIRRVKVQLNNNDQPVRTKTLFNTIKIQSFQEKPEVFHSLTEGQKASCNLSQSLFDMLFNVLVSQDISFKGATPLKPLIINQICVYEDGHVRIKVQYSEDINQSRTYKIFRLIESKTRVLIPCYYEKAAEIQQLHVSYELINSWALDNGILLVLFNSTIENKIKLFVLHDNFNHNTLPTPLFEIDSDQFSTLESVPKINLLYSTFNPNTRILLFLVVKKKKANIVRLLINEDYQTVDKPLIRSVYGIIPIEAASQNLEFVNFIINTNGNDAVAVFRGFLNSGDKKDVPVHHFCVFFDPFQLAPLHTIKYTKFYFKELPEKFQTSLLTNGRAMPIFYSQGTLVLLYQQCISVMQNDKIYLSTNAILHNLKSDTGSYNTNPPENANNQQSNLSYIEYYVNCNVRRSSIPDETLYKMSAVYYLQNIPYFLSQSGKEIKIADAPFTTSQAQFIKQPLVYFLDPTITFKPPEFKSLLGVYDYNEIEKVTVHTFNNYGYNICKQMALPEPNMIPLELALINISQDMIEESRQQAKSEDLIGIVECVNSTKTMHQIALFETDKENQTNTLHRSIAPFLIQFFTSINIVVDECISDPVISSLLQSNFQAILNNENNAGFKTISHLCYTLRVNRFPNFPFLRMTTKCPSYHIGVISENGSSLLNWLTGISFSQLPNNTLAIGSNPIPHISKSTKCVNDKMKLLDTAVDGLTNVVGSLFTVEESSSCQVIAFICALCACDTIILDFSSYAKLLRFFTLFFDYADTVYDSFDLNLFPNEISSAAFTDMSHQKPMPQIAVFCDLGIDDEQTTAMLIGDINNLILERGLEPERSFAVKVIQNIPFVTMSQSTSAKEKALRLKNMDFVNCTKAWRPTNDLIALLRDMSAIFGQQVDYEANGGFFGFAKNSTELNSRFNLFVPYVKRDDDPKFRNELFSLALILLKTEENQYKEIAKNLLLKSADLGLQEAKDKLNELQ